MSLPTEGNRLTPFLVSTSCRRVIKLSGIDLTNAHEFIDGHLVSTKVSHIVQAIQDYSPELEVKWRPPDARENDTLPAYAIIHNPPNGEPYVMFYVMKDEDMDERVLRRIIYNDQRNGQRTLSELEAFEEANKLMQRQKYLDELEALHDVAAHMWRTHKNTYTYTNPVTGERKVHKE